jgi:hypothetical protein
MAPRITKEEFKTPKEFRQRLNTILTEYKNIEGDFIWWMSGNEYPKIEDPRESRNRLIDQYKELQIYFKELETCLDKKTLEDIKFRMETVDNMFSGFL